MEVDHLPLAVGALPDLGAARVLFERAEVAEVGVQLAQIGHDRHVAGDRHLLVACGEAGGPAVHGGLEHLPELDDVVDPVVVALVEVVPAERVTRCHVGLEELVLRDRVRLDEPSVQRPHLGLGIAAHGQLGRAAATASMMAGC